MAAESPDPHALLIDDENDEFLPKAKKVLKEIFDRFDLDKSGTWNINELQSFAEATNGGHFDKTVLDEIKESFDHKKDELSFDGFYDMFHLQTLSDPAETLKDFKKHGYDNNLELVTSRAEDLPPRTPLTEEANK